MMLGVSFLTFAVFRIIPGDATHFICPYCTEDQRELLRHDLGLDRAWFSQYAHWLTGLFTGDLGESYFTHLPVTTELARRLPVTLELMALTVVLCWPSAYRWHLSRDPRQHPLDRLARFRRPLRKRRSRYRSPSLDSCGLADSRSSAMATCLLRGSLHQSEEFFFRR
jgi:hypothetical protein